MTFTEAAAEVLRIAGKPLHYKEITELAIEKNLLSHVGKSPEVTMGARLAALLKKEDQENPIVRVKPGVFGLREWDGKKKKKGAAEEPEHEDESAGIEMNALDIEAAAARRQSPAPAHEDDEPMLVSGEDALRADLAASGAEMFDDEDDDDQPILSGPGSDAEPRGGADAGPNSAAGQAADDSGRRRRRRRRRRGGRPEGEEQRTTTTTTSGSTSNGVSERSASPRGDGISPTAVVSVDGNSPVETARDPLAPAPRPMIRDRQQIMAGGAPTGIDIPPGEAEELSGRELADATVMVLSGFDRTQGSVAVRAVVEALVRRGRIAGNDNLMATAQLTASLRADNLRRQAAGQRPRFRFGGGSRQDGSARIALTDWALPSDLVRLELDAIAAIERYREAARRTMLRKLQELPGHALMELVLLGLERVGMTNIRSVRRAGAPGGEAHFAAVHRNGSDEIRTALVIRKDGREVGRERVSDLRGALHHYGPAAAGWLVTTGQVLSGAREEAGAPAAPIALFDGIALCRLLEDNDVGVIRTKLTTAIPDLELYETLRGA